MEIINKLITPPFIELTNINKKVIITINKGKT